MRIFEYSWEEATDWVIAKDLEDAKDFYCVTIGEVDLEDCDIKEIPKSEWKNHYIIDIDEMEPDEGEYEESEYSGGYKILETFEERASRAVSRDIIATTAY